MVERACQILVKKFFNALNGSHQVTIQPNTTRLSTANQMPIQFNGRVATAIQIGPKTYEPTIYVLIEAASIFLLGFNFPGTSNCDGFFLKNN